MIRRSVIAISGGSCSGKTTIALSLKAGLEELSLTSIIISVDAYYLSDAIDYDNPVSFNTGELQIDLKAIATSGKGEISITENHTSKPIRTACKLPENGFLIVDGMYSLDSSFIGLTPDLGVFVDEADDVRCLRRLVRDVTKYGMKIEQSAKYYLENVRPGYLRYVSPLRTKADTVLPGNQAAESTRRILKHLISIERI